MKLPLYILFCKWSLYNCAAQVADILLVILLKKVNTINVYVNTLTFEPCTLINSIASAFVGNAQSDIPFFYWLNQLSTILNKDESPLSGYNFITWAVSFTRSNMEHQVGRSRFYIFVVSMDWKWRTPSSEQLKDSTHIPFHMGRAN